MTTGTLGIPAAVRRAGSRDGGCKAGRSQSGSSTTDAQAPVRTNHQFRRGRRTPESTAANPTAVGRSGRGTGCGTAPEDDIGHRILQGSEARTGRLEGRAGVMAADNGEQDDEGHRAHEQPGCNPDEERKRRGGDDRPRPNAPNGVRHDSGRSSRTGSTKTWTQHMARADALPGLSARKDACRNTNQAARSRPQVMGRTPTTCRNTFDTCSYLPGCRAAGLPYDAGPASTRSFGGGGPAIRQPDDDIAAGTVFRRHQRATDRDCSALDREKAAIVLPLMPCRIMAPSCRMNRLAAEADEAERIAQTSPG